MATLIASIRPAPYAERLGAAPGRFLYECLSILGLIDETIAAADLAPVADLARRRLGYLIGDEEAIHANFEERAQLDRIEGQHVDGLRERITKLPVDEPQPGPDDRLPF